MIRAFIAAFACMLIVGCSNPEARKNAFIDRCASYADGNPQGVAECFNVAQKMKWN